MVIYLSLLVCLVGVAMYFLAAHPKVSETGRLMFAIGLLAFLLGPAVGRLFSVTSQ